MDSSVGCFVDYSTVGKPLFCPESHGAAVIVDLVISTGRPERELSAAEEVFHSVHKPYYYYYYIKYN